MATATKTTSKTIRDARPMLRPAKSRPFLLNAEQYLRMADEGFFGDRRVELIEGKVIEMAAMNPPHWIAVAKTTEALRRVFKKPFFVLSQLPLKLDDLSEPEPDVFVVKTQNGDVNELDKLDALSQTQLVVEVSDATLREDRTTKARLYAAAGIVEYWIVDVNNRQLEVRREPTKRGYSSTRTLAETEIVTPLSAPDAKIKIADLLP